MGWRKEGEEGSGVEENSSSHLPHTDLHLEEEHSTYYCLFYLPSPVMFWKFTTPFDDSVICHFIPAYMPGITRGRRVAVILTWGKILFLFYMPLPLH